MKEGGVDIGKLDIDEMHSALYPRSQEDMLLKSKQGLMQSNPDRPIWDDAKPHHTLIPISENEAARLYDYSASRKELHDLDEKLPPNAPLDKDSYQHLIDRHHELMQHM